MKRLVYLLALAACGDNKAAPDASNPFGDGSADAAARDPQIVVIAGDFKAGDPGVITEIDEITLLTHENVVGGAVGDDPVLRRFGNELFVVNRADGNNITILDAETFAVLGQIATGAGSNPQDVAVVGNKLYVPALGTAGVLVIDRTSGAMSTIDLSADDPGDHLPDCNSVFAVGTQVFVTCEILDNFTPAGNGKAHVIDTATDTVTASFDLQHKNPFGVFQALPDGSLAMPTVDFSDGSGCVEKITTTGTPASAGCVVNNTDLGGYASGMTVSGSTLYVAVPAADFVHAAIRPFDLTGSTLGAAMNPDAEVIGDLTTCPDGKLAVTDKGDVPGVRLYDATHEITQAPVAVTLKPQSTPSLACY